LSYYTPDQKGRKVPCAAIVGDMLANQLSADGVHDIRVYVVNHCIGIFREEELANVDEP